MPKHLTTVPLPPHDNGRGETEILLESFRPKSEKVVHTRERVRKDSSKEKENEWLVTYTDVNGIVSTLSEINDYLRTKKPDIFSLDETKLSDSEDVPVGEKRYNITEIRKMEME